ncbi:MAG: RsmG family class I SAM-dependent methyltransferase, partial [Oscillospiraceae bacterium]
FRDKFDIATARAVALLPELCEYCLPFVRKGGRFIAMKGSSGKNEAAMSEKTAGILGGGKPEVVEYALPNGDERSLVIIEKLSETPAKYPRSSAQIARRAVF